MIAATGWAISFETSIVTEAELTRHAVVGAASTSSVVEAVQHLVEAGIWEHIPGVGYDCGATEHIEAKVDRIAKARHAVEVRIEKRQREQDDAAASPVNEKPNGVSA